jgi:hypothetical protein
VGGHPKDLLGRVRRACSVLPGATERPSHGAPTWFVRDRRAFVTAWLDGHHGTSFPHLWCAAPPGAQEGLVAADPRRYFRPPYVGHRGWVGVRLDGEVDWDAVEDLCEQAWRTVAPAALLAGLGGPGAG